MNYIVHGRQGVQGQSVMLDSHSLVDIPEKYNEVLKDMQKFADEIHTARQELGRWAQALFNISDMSRLNTENKALLEELGRAVQITHHLVHVCNTAEKNLTSAKEGMLKDLKITDDGKWAIDFENKKIGKVLSLETQDHRVV